MACSFVQMSSTEVKKLANECLARIEARNKRVLEALVDEEREKLQKSWWRRLFKMPLPSDEELRQSLLNDGGMFSLQFQLDMYGWRSRQIADELIKAATHAETVNVAAEDLNYIA